MTDSRLLETIESFKERRRKQDNDLFYYINTMAEVDNILFELRNSLEDAKNSHQDEEANRIANELSDWEHDYQEYVEECQRILKDMHLSVLSPYEDVESVQQSSEWKDVNHILMMLTRYHDLLLDASKKDVSLEMYEKFQSIVDSINQRYAKVFSNKEMDEYNINLFGKSKNLIEKVILPKPSNQTLEEEEPLFEEIPESFFSDDASIADVLSVPEKSESDSKKTVEPVISTANHTFEWPSFLSQPQENTHKVQLWPGLSNDLKELQRKEQIRKEEEEKNKSIQDLISNSLPHIIEEKQGDWKLYLQDVSHHEVAKQLITFMEKLEKGYSINQFYEDMKDYENGQDLLYGVRKYSKEYQRQEEENLKRFEEKINTPFTYEEKSGFVRPSFLPHEEVSQRGRYWPGISSDLEELQKKQKEREEFEEIEKKMNTPFTYEEKSSFVRPSFLPHEEPQNRIEQWPVLNPKEKARGRKEIISDLLYYIHLHDVQNSKKTDLSKIIGMIQIDMEDLSSLDFTRKTESLENEQILNKIRDLLGEYCNVTNKNISEEEVINLVQGITLEEKQSPKSRVFSWVRKTKEKLSSLIQSKKKIFYTVALAGLALGTIAAGKNIRRSSHAPIQENVAIENEDIQPLILENTDVPVIEVVSELPEVNQTRSENYNVSSIPYQIGDHIYLKENALIYKTEYLNTNFGGDMQGRIPSYQRDLVRQIEGIGFRLADGTVKLVYDSNLVQEYCNKGYPVESILTFDGFYSAKDAIIVENNLGR